MTCLTSFLSSAQIINFREPVTLDFLDAELEDNNKEEVKRVQTSAKMAAWLQILHSPVYRHAASVVTASFCRSLFRSVDR